MPLISQIWHDLAWWQAGERLRIANVQHCRTFLGAQFVGRFRARHERALIGVDLTVFGPPPQGAVADLQLGAGFGAPRTSDDGLIDQANGSLAMWGTDHASSSPPQIADAFFRRTGSAAVSVNARSLRARSRSSSLIRFFLPWSPVPGARCWRGPSHSLVHTPTAMPRSALNKAHACGSIRPDQPH